MKIMRVLLTLFCCMLISIGYLYGQKEDRIPDIHNSIIFKLEQDVKKRKIKIGFIDTTYDTKYFISVKVVKDGAYNYIKIDDNRYYLNCDKSPSLLDDICTEFKKIEIDTTVRLGEPLSKSISIVLLITNTGEVKQVGIARRSGDNYYDTKTIEMLKGCYKYKSEPAKLSDNSVFYLLRVSFNFYQGVCFAIPYG